MFGKIFLLLFIALGIGMAVPKTRARMVEKATPVMDALKAKLVPMRLEAMADQLDFRVKRGEGIPSNFAAWLDREFTGAPEDPWGRLYYVQAGRGSFTVGSLGPDGKENTADDIKVTRSMPR